MMKRKLRVVLLLGIIAVLAIFLSSCDVVDELKEQKIIALDEDYEFLEYKGNKYQILPNDRSFSINTSDTKTCYIVEEDVPLLLIDTFGSACRYDEELDLIVYTNEVFYCTIENYEKYSKILKEGKLDHYKIDYWDYDYETGDVFRVYMILEDEATELISGTMDNVTGTAYEYLDSDWNYLPLDRCDSEGLIEKESVFELYRDVENDEYGILIYPDDYSEDYIIKLFPEEHEDVIEELFRKYYRDGYYDYHEAYYY